MFEYVLQWMVEPEVCKEKTVLQSTPSFLNFGSVRCQWNIKLTNNNNVIQFSLISAADNGLLNVSFSSISIKCINKKTETIAELITASYKSYIDKNKNIVHYYLKVIHTTLAELTADYKEAFMVIVSFNLTPASRLCERLCLTGKATPEPAKNDASETAKPPTVLPQAPVVQKPVIATKLYVFAAEKDRAEQILQDYGRLLNDHRHSDLKLIVEDHHFLCHKSILSARCEVFADIIQYNGNDDKLTLLQAIDVETAADLLQYIYTGRATNIGNTAERLLVAADMFKLNLLKLRCEEILRSQVKMENALQLLRLSDRVDSVDLKKDSLNFIRKNLRSLLNNCPAFKDEISKDPAFFYDLMLQIA